MDPGPHAVLQPVCRLSHLSALLCNCTHFIYCRPLCCVLYYPSWGLVVFEPETAELSMEGGGYDALTSVCAHSAPSDQTGSKDMWSCDAQAQHLLPCTMGHVTISTITSSL